MINSFLGIVTFYKLSHKDFTPLEFLAELTQHIPKKWEQTTRFYGQYSARTRGVKTTQYAEPIIIPIAQIEESNKPTSFWAANIKKVFEIDPLTIYDFVRGRL